MKVQDTVVCLVGSTKPQWRQKYREVLEDLTLMGNAVFTVVWFRRDFMEQVHFLKIRASEVVVCIDRKAVGKHTAMEMEYVKEIGKTVCFFDEIEAE